MKICSFSRLLQAKLLFFIVICQYFAMFFAFVNKNLSKQINK